MTTINYKNGNADITIDKLGTRVIEYENNLKLDYPLNIDIRVSTKCSFGQNKDGSWVLCNFCHEDAKTYGEECNYNDLKLKLIGLPKGIELAIGSNNLTNELLSFLQWSTEQGYINNLTINQGHLKRDCHKILLAIENNWIQGLGISYRSNLKFNIPLELLNYQNTVFHVISGIDKFEDIYNLHTKGVKKNISTWRKRFWS